MDMLFRRKLQSIHDIGDDLEVNELGPILDLGTRQGLVTPTSPLVLTQQMEETHQQAQAEVSLDQGTCRQALQGTLGQCTPTANPSYTPSYPCFNHYFLHKEDRKHSKSRWQQCKVYHQTPHRGKFGFIFHPDNVRIKFMEKLPLRGFDSISLTPKVASEPKTGHFDF